MDIKQEYMTRRVNHDQTTSFSENEGALTRPRRDGGPVDSFSALGDAIIGLQKRIEKSGLASVG